jgi:hypothetical protein
LDTTRNIIYFKKNSVSFELKGQRYPAQLFQNDEKKIKFKLIRDVENTWGDKAKMEYAGVFFNWKKKFSMNGSPSAYATLGDAWGSYEIKYSQSEKNNNKKNGALSFDWV